jgi:hypothetical protein
MHSEKYWEAEVNKLIHKMSASAPPWKPGSIHVLRDVGVLEVGAEAKGNGKAMPPHAAEAGAKAKGKGKAMPPPAAEAGAKAEAKAKATAKWVKTGKAMPPHAAEAGAKAKGKGKAMPPPAAKAGAKAEAKAKAKAKCVKTGKGQKVPEAQRRWVHIHWPPWPDHGTAFFVHRDSTVGELLRKIAKWYGLHVSECDICLDKCDRRLARDTQWKDCGEWDIEVTFVKNATTNIVENRMVFQ